MKRISVICIILLIGICPLALAQTRGLGTEHVSYEKTKDRLALVIGNYKYKSGADLPNPGNDADSMKFYLEKLKFDVIMYKNLDKVGMDKAISAFEEKLRSYKMGMFFYAGHGVQVKEINYLVPVNADPQSVADAKDQCISLDYVMEKIEEAEPKVGIVLLDACRNNPFKRSVRDLSNAGLAQVSPPGGMIIGFAAKPGTTASDGKGTNGVYTQSLLKNINSHDPLTVMLSNVYNDVYQLTDGEQESCYFVLSGINPYLNFKEGYTQVIYIDTTSSRRTGSIAKNSTPQKEVFTLPSLHGAKFLQRALVYKLAFSVQGNTVSFAGEIKDYPVNGKAKFIQPSTLQITEGNVKGMFIISADGQQLTGNILIKEPNLSADLSMKRSLY